MANWSDLKAAVASIVKTNGNKEITGQLLQNVLNNIISNVGLNSSFAGIATPETNPGTPDGNVFYLATTEGTYSNFNGIVINSGEAVILEWKGSWVKKESGFATKEKLSELEENTNQKLSELGSEVKDIAEIKEDDNYIKIITDSEGRLLFAIKTDGSVEFFKGVPQSIRSYIEELLKNKADVVDLFDIGVYEENDEYIKVVKDAEGKLLFGIKTDGSVEFFKGVPQSIRKYIDEKTNNNPSEGNNYTHSSEQLSKIPAIKWDFKSYRYGTSDLLPTNYIPSLTFIHISDLHGGLSNKKQINYAVDVLNKFGGNTWMPKTPISFMLCTGDVKLSHYTDDYTYFIDACKRSLQPIYAVAGNHDVGETKSVSLTGTDEMFFNENLKPILDTFPPNGYTGKSYYYHDFKNEKVRLIALYEYESDCELDDNDLSMLKYKRGIRAFRQEQITWIVNTLLSTPVGFGVIIAKHQPESEFGESQNNFSCKYQDGTTPQSSYINPDIIADIVDAFIGRKPISKQYPQTGGVITTINVDADFSLANENTEFICYCSGHLHSDNIRFLKKYPNQVELNVGCDNSWYTVGSDMAQIEDEYSENLISIYNINRNEGKINILRIGADITNDCKKRDILSINYK